ncbi:MAG TPA: HAD family hydrolase [Candidatus Limnocylindrales bacterium]
MSPKLHPALDDIQLVVFDKDGTLISFEAMWSGWARELGSRLEIAARRPVAGDVFATIGYDPTTDRVLPGGPLTLDTMAGIHERVGAELRRWCPSVAAARRVLADAWFEPDPVERAVPLADLAGLFSAIRGSGRRIAIATTDDRRPTEATLEGLGLAALIDAVRCGDDRGPTKPDAATLLGLAAELGVHVGRIAMVGDTPADLRMARAAGAGRSIGVASGVASAAELAPNADLILANVGELAGDAAPAARTAD